MKPQAETREVVDRILSSHAKAAVRVVATEELATGRGVVERAIGSDPIPGIGPTVIVKRRDLPGFDETNLETEAAALELLTQAGGDVAPRLLGESMTRVRRRRSRCGAGSRSRRPSRSPSRPARRRARFQCSSNGC